MSEAAGASQRAPAAGVIRFGSFEVDRVSGELRRKGLKVKLTGQAFEVLLVLLERPAQVVTREELREKLWSQDTFVDFEQGLNKAINKVRDALGDNADNPRFIETLPRRGYRFLAPVTPAEASSSPSDIALKLAVSAKPVWRYRRGLYMTAAVVALAVLAYLLRPALPPPALSNYAQLTNDGLPKYLIGTDGSRLYFGRRSDQPAQMSVNGGNEARWT